MDATIMEYWQNEDPGRVFRLFLIRANLLAMKLIRENLPQDVEECILSGRPGRFAQAGYDIELSCNGSPETGRYGMMLNIKDKSKGNGS